MDLSSPKTWQDGIAAVIGAPQWLIGAGSEFTMEPQSILYSVIITAYNYGRYLKRAINSVLSQDFDRYEIIVVDDGSEDDTRAIAALYGDRIRYVHQQHSGPFAAAQTGFRLAAEAMSFSSTRTTGSNRTR